MVVSIDVAYLISMTSFDGEVERIDLNYDGSHPLKGVMGGASYPVFWINMSGNNSLAVKEDRLRAQTVANREDVKEFCDAFYQEYSSFTFRPFIINDVGQTLAKMPQWYAQYHALLVKNFNLPDNEYVLDSANDIAATSTELDQDDVNEVLLNLRSPDTADEVHNLQLNDKIIHEIFGIGKVIEIDGYKIKVLFDNSETKTILPKFLKKLID